MTDKIFDGFIKGKLKDHSAPVPSDMWERILKKKEPEKPAGLFGYKTLLSIFLLIATCTVITYLMWQPAAINIVTDNNLTSSQANKTVDKVVSPSGNNLEDLDATPVSEEPGNNVKGVSESLIEGNNTTTKQASSISPISKVNNDAPKGKSNRVLPSNIYKSNGNKVASKVFSATEQPLVEGSSFSLAEFNRNQISSFTSIAKDERHNHSLLTQLNSFSMSCALDCPTARRPGRNDWYIEVFASPDYAMKSIVKNNSIDANYFKRKDSTERMEGAFTAGIRLNKSVGENILLKTGIQYSQINEQFKYRTENERRQTTVITIRTIIRAPGDTVRISDTSIVEQIGYREKVTHNKYRSIDVPIILSYEWGNENWKKSINAGVLLNLHSWQEGEMLDTSFVPVAFNKSSGQTFKTNIGVGVYLGVSLIKSVGDKTEVFAEPYFKYNISNMTTDKGLFNQKFNVAGLNLGVRYKLSGGRQRYISR